MRPGQNRRMRGRNNNNNSGGNNNNRKSPNPLQRSYESNGPDVKVRGTAQHVAEKYLQLARDAQSSSDPVAAENYFQHAEHYYRILLAAQEQMSQQFGHSFPPNRAFNDTDDEGEEDGDDESQAFQPGAPQPEIRNGGMNGNGYSGQNRHVDGAPRQDGEAGEGRPQGGQRFERQDRNGQDRNGQDRNGQDRNFQDRGNQDRNNQDRNGNSRRFDRNDRNDRGERRFERPDSGQGGYMPRPDAPRSDIPAPPSAEQPDLAPIAVQGGGRFERPERGPRPDRAERRPRRDRDADGEAEGEVAAALPSFLTTPVRVPAAPTEEPAMTIEPPSQEDGDAASDAAPKRPRGRRRSPREVMDALGSDGENAAE